VNSYHRLRGSIADSHRTGVGASDIPTLALLNLRYVQTPYLLWRVKTGRDAPWQGNERTYWGHRLEGLVLREYVRQHYEETIADEFYRAYLRNRSLGELKVLTEFRHPKYRFALAHPDLLIEGDRLVEAKSHGYHAARRGEDADFGYSYEDRSQNGIPAAVFLQVQWQAFCAELGEVDVAALINTNDYREYGPVLADPRTQEKCLALAERFWWHVEHDQEPKPENWEDVQTMFPRPQATTAMVSGDAELAARQMVERWTRYGDAMDRLKSRRDDIKNALGLLIGENSVLTTSEGVKLASSWQQKNPLSCDWKAFEREYPEVYAKAREAGIITQSSRRELRPAKMGREER